MNRNRVLCYATTMCDRAEIDFGTAMGMNGNSNSEGAESSYVFRQEPTHRNVIWFTFQVVLRVFFGVWLRYRARGIEKIPPEGGGLMLINHQSFLDPLMVGLPLSRPVSFVARDSLFRVPIVGTLLRSTYVMPIKRTAASSKSVRETVRRMNFGFLIGMFPEGTRSADGSVGQLKPGFAALLRRSKLPVYPVGIAGAGSALPRNAWFLYPRKVRVVFGEPLSAEEIEPFCQRGREKALIALVRERILDCQQEAEQWRRQ